MILVRFAVTLVVGAVFGLVVLPPLFLFLLGLADAWYCASGGECR